MTTPVTEHLPAPSAAATSSSGWWSRLITVLLEFGAFTGLLYLIGWTRTQETYRELGINPSLIQLSTTEYIGRSIDVIFQPMVALLALAVVLALAHRFVMAPNLKSESPARAKIARRFLIGVTVLSIAGLALAITAVMAQESVGEPLWILPPAVLVLSAGALIYTGKTLGVLRDDSFGRWMRRALAVFGIVGIIWGSILHAEWVGKQFARDADANLADHPEVTLYSGKRLSISGSGVTPGKISPDNSRYLFCYQGLRMIIRTGNNYILAPADYEWGSDALYVIPASDDVRLDFMYTENPGQAPKCG
jgi:hypothetical protein